MSYIGNSPGVASQRVEQTLKATAGQVLFTTTSGYTLGYLDVYQNGSKLVVGEDYTATDGVTFALTTAANLNDDIDVVAYLPRGLSDGYLKTEADAKFATSADATFTGTATVTANNSTDALHITQQGAGNALVVEDASSDNSPFVIDNIGNVINGWNTALPIGIFTPRYQQHGNTAGSNSLGITSWQTGTDVAANILLARGDATTIGNYTAIGSTDALGNIRFCGADGTQMIEAAKISTFVDSSAVATDDISARMSFFTRPAGASSALTERMRINSQGNVGIGSTSLANVSLRLSKNITGAVTSYGMFNDGTVQADVTTTAYGFRTALNTAATAAIGSLVHYGAQQNIIGAGSTITNQYGFIADASLIGATTNFGFYGAIAAGTGRYNFYAAGTADNYFAGSVGIGTSSPVAKLHTLSSGAYNGTVNSRTGLHMQANIATGGFANTRIQFSYDPATPKGYIECGVYGSDYLAFGSTAGATEQLRIDSSGNVGIGTSNPLRRLSVLGGTSDNVPVRVTAGTGSSDCFIDFKDPNTTADYRVRVGSAGDNLVLYAGGQERMRIDSNGRLGIGTSAPARALDIRTGSRTMQLATNPTTGYYGCGLYLSGDIGSTEKAWMVGTRYTGGNTALVFEYSTNDMSYAGDAAALTYAEKMRIDSSGNLLVGVTASTSGSHWMSSSQVLGQQILTISKPNQAVNQNNNYYMQFSGTSGSADGYINTNGSAVLVISDASDRRVKENIVDATYGLNTIQALRPVEYSRIGETQRIKGFIAQEVKEVIPECVTIKDESAYGGLEDMHILEMQTMIPILVKAIQEQQALIEQLTARLDAANL